MQNITSPAKNEFQTIDVLQWRRSQHWASNQAYTALKDITETN